MTTAEAQALLAAIDSHIDGKAGEIYGIDIRKNIATVTVSWTTFQASFSGQSADREGKLWSKVVGSVTYTSKETTGPVATTVPT